MSPRPKERKKKAPGARPGALPISTLEGETNGSQGFPNLVILIHLGFPVKGRILTAQRQVKSVTQRVHVFHVSRASSIPIGPLHVKTGALLCFQTQTTTVNLAVCRQGQLSLRSKAYTIQQVIALVIGYAYTNIGVKEPANIVQANTGSPDLLRYRR